LCLADADIWMREAVNHDGLPYYKYLAIDVDDTLCISHEPEKTMNAIAQLYYLKDNSVQVPTTYLGAQIVQYKLPSDNKKIRCGMSSNHYVLAAIKNVEYELSLWNKTLATNATTPLSYGYRPELDTSPLLNPLQANYYQNLIGVLRWSIELGRVDILTHVSIMSSFLAAWHEGHLSQVLHIFAYLKRYSRSTMVFDDTTPIIDNKMLPEANWMEFYRYETERKPPNALEP
jgi:hypothetical protein